jgi:hypothetical protein
MKRLILIVLVVLALAPGTWLRSKLPPLDLDGPVTITPLTILDRQTIAGEVQVLAGWRMVSGNDHFGGYSALVALDDQHLIAASDRGRIMRLDISGDAPRVQKMDYLAGTVQPDKRLIDVESMTRDPATGRFWLAYEGVNAVERLNPELQQPERTRPEQMKGWSKNKGAEALARLNDGRFIVMAEGSGGLGKETFAGLLFPSDPLSKAVAEEFRFAPPAGYRPVDMVQIPDGRVLILVRRVHWGFMPRFTAKLMVADSAEIVAGKMWSGRIIADFAPPIPTDNYEGLAMWPRDDGLINLWMISDDNRAGFQNTYLLKMLWDPSANGIAASAE